MYSSICATVYLMAKLQLIRILPSSQQAANVQYSIAVHRGEQGEHEAVCDTREQQR